MYRGWWAVVAGSVFHAALGGLFHTGFSVYYLPLQRAFHVSSTSLSTAFAIRSLEGGVEGPAVGYLVDRFGPRIVVLASIVAAGVGLILLSLTQSFTQFLIVFLSVIAIGFSAPHHGVAAAINFWFRRRLGTAMSLAAVGSSVGGFLITPIVAWVVITHGWRVASLASGVALLVIGVPLALLLRTPKAGEADEDNSPMTGVTRAPSVAHAATETFDGDFTVREALHTRAYWLMALAIGLRLTAQAALLVHFVPMLVSRGVPEITAALLLSAQAIIKLPVVLGAGYIADRWSRQKTSALSMTMGCAAAASLLLGPDGLVTGVLFIVFLAGAESCNNVTWALVGQFFGRRHFGTLRGSVSLVQSLLSTISPIAAGFIFDTTKNYRLAFVLIGIIYLAAMVAFWFLKAPSSPRREPAQAVNAGATKVSTGA